MEVNGKNGKYTTRLSQAGKETTIHLTVFLSFFVFCNSFFKRRSCRIVCNACTSCHINCTHSFYY